MLQPKISASFEMALEGGGKKEFTLSDVQPSQSDRLETRETAMPNVLQSANDHWIWLKVDNGDSVMVEAWRFVGEGWNFRTTFSGGLSLKALTDIKLSEGVLTQ